MDTCADERRHPDCVICGSTENRVPFAQRVQPIQISPMGACLSGIAYALVPGQLVTIHCGEFTGCMRVSWTGEPGSSREGLVGLRWANYTRTSLPLGFCERGEKKDLELALTVQ